jgi:hypothetical protein
VGLSLAAALLLPRIEQGAKRKKKFRIVDFGLRILRPFGKTRAKAV